MRGTLNSDDLAKLNDLGIGWRHDSQPYLETVRIPQLCNEPVATWPVSTEATLVSEQKDNSEAINGPLGISDPLARELYVREELRKQASARSITNPSEAWATSIIRVHEPVHAGIADHFTHYYDHPRLYSFLKTLRFVQDAPRQNQRQLVETVLNPALHDAWSRLRSSEWAQEAAAIRAQRRFLKQFNSSGRDPGWARNIERIQYHRLIQDYLDEGILPPDEILGHALGDWLGKKVSNQPWRRQVDPLDLAFRLHIPAADNDLGWDPNPNTVLLAAASISTGKLAHLDAQSQLTYLIERVEDLTGKSIGAVVRTPGSDIPRISNCETVRTVDAFDSWRNLNYRLAVDNERWTAVPLLLKSYPGKRHTTKTTLWDLLNGFLADSIKRGDQLIRRLWLESKYEWAKNTPLYNMAVQLWYLRDHFLLPLIRETQRNTSIDTKHHLSITKQIANNKIPRGGSLDEANSPYEYPGRIHQLDKQVRFLHDQTSIWRKRYQKLFEGLETLGKAIHEENESVIHSFYNA